MARPSSREQLIDAGLETLHRQGFNGTSVQDITEAAGVPKGSFYNHFVSKEALALEAVQRFWENGAQRRAPLEDERVDPVERLQHYFRKLAHGAIKDRFRRGCMIGNFSAEMASQSPDIAHRLSDLYKEWSRAIEACVEEAEQAGRLGSGLPAATVAAFLLNAWEGALLRAKVEQSPSALEHFDKVVFSGLFKPAGS